MTHRACGRRDFLAATARGALVAAFRSGAIRVRKPATLVVLLETQRQETPRAAARSLGVVMGVEEAARSSGLFGGEVRLERIATPARLAQRLGSRTAAGEILTLIGGETVDDCTALAAAAARGGALYVNALCASDDLRGRSCNRHMFHVAPSERMLADARATAGGSPLVTTWDASLQSFGADTLNQRFRARFDRPMDGDAWAGWFSVKAFAEGVLRVSHASSAALIDFFESDRGGVDGHKGRPLSFRPWDHQLRQPLYLRTSPEQRTPVEVPRATGDPGRDSRDILDVLGTKREESPCRFQEQ